jgi:alanine racemase
MFRPTVVRLDLEALRHNLRLLKTWNGGDFFCPMLKANAYGHGVIPIAHAATDVGVDALGVSLIEEGLQLRAAGITMPILVFAPFDHVAASAMLTHQLSPVLTRMEDLTALTALKLKSPIDVHVKFNTGMCRLGFDVGELPELHRRFNEHTELNLRGLCTHLTHGEEPELPDGPTARQLALFKNIAKKMNEKMPQGFAPPMILHAHKSATLSTYARLGIKKPSGIGARPGIAIYGLPFEGREAGPGLRPVLRWATRLSNVHKIPKGSSVSYGSRWHAERPSVIGVIPVGYGDGYLRALSNRAKMLFRGRRVPSVGSVCMDYIMLDLTDAVQDGLPQLGEEIVLIGKQTGHGTSEEITAGELAELAGTIAYEVVTRISSRVVREV